MLLDVQTITILLSNALCLEKLAGLYRERSSADRSKTSSSSSSDSLLLAKPAPENTENASSVEKTNDVTEDVETEKSIPSDSDSTRSLPSPPSNTVKDKNSLTCPARISLIIPTCAKPSTVLEEQTAQQTVVVSLPTTPVDDIQARSFIQPLTNDLSSLKIPPSSQVEEVQALTGLDESLSYFLVPTEVAPSQPNLFASPLGDVINYEQQARIGPSFPFPDEITAKVVTKEASLPLSINFAASLLLLLFGLIMIPTFLYWVKNLRRGLGVRLMGFVAIAREAKTSAYIFVNDRVPSPASAIKHMLNVLSRANGRAQAVVPQDEAEYVLPPVVDEEGYIEYLPETHKYWLLYLMLVFLSLTMLLCPAYWPGNFDDTPFHMTD